MNQEEWISSLKKEGFENVYVIKDDPNFEYSTHTHEKACVHIILAGSMGLQSNDGLKELSQGERINIPAGTTHSAKMGPQGCKYIVAE